VIVALPRPTLSTWSSRNRRSEEHEGNVPRTARLPLGKTLRAAAHPLTGSAGDYGPLIELIGDARIVLLGEASHGTHEFYRERARITRRLIEEHGFTLVAVEADWPDAYRVNRWVRGTGSDTVAAEALGDFLRFPRWMWRNRDVLAFVSWLRDHNDTLPSGARKAGFYGLDLYSLFSSIEAVIRYLDQVDPEAPGGPATAMAASTTSGRIPRPTAMRRRSACRPPARTTWCTSSSSSRAGPPSCRGAMAASRKTSTSTRSRTHGW
jgi:erythromycin esterase-like protein